MKKLLVVFVAFVAIAISSCGTPRSGAGCPTASKSKPFRA